MHTIHATPQDNPTQPEQPSPTDSQTTQEASMIEAQHARVPEAAFLVGCMARVGAITLDVDDQGSIESFVLSIRALAGALNDMYPDAVAQDLPFPW